MKKTISVFILLSAAASLLAAVDNAPNTDNALNTASLANVPWQMPKTWVTTSRSNKSPVTSSSTPTTSSIPTRSSAPAPGGGPTQAPGGGPSTPVQAPGGGPSIKIMDKIVMFTKEACPYCQYMMPIMKKVQAKFGNKIKFIYADILENPEYPGQYGFSTVPYIAYFKNDKLLDAHGSNDKTITVEQVIQKIQGLGMGEVDGGGETGRGEVNGGGGETSNMVAPGAK